MKRRRLGFSRMPTEFRFWLDLVRSGAIDRHGFNGVARIGGGRGGLSIYDLRMTMYDWKHFLRGAPATTVRRFL